ncbi:PilW family protein [Rhizobacter sp. Root1221]|uniref:PilW family protein n=1 Tax=Rhizobacter sp. Root1221 TaxID=1736433 RepID=UPI000702091B|nr:hypothetical protein [Rhizobacter sp. Root1221]KQV82985.1 hypothetical protein ASC87_08515 [Rhizobacter sp. Root1221]
MSIPSRHRTRPLGLSVLELMVGLAVGLVVTALGVSAMARQATASRRVLLEARVTQDLRAAADLLARHVRRAGHWSGAARGVWRPGAARPATNPHTFSPEAPDLLRFTYSSPAGGPGEGVATNDHFGFRLRQGILDIELGDGHWQPLTDPGVLRVTRLQLIPHHHERMLPAPCAQPCPAAAGLCPPRVQVRGVDVLIDAEATTDASLHRQASAHVRPRNDVLVGQCLP